jgi:hypothetical protein
LSDEQAQQQQDEDQAPGWQVVDSDGKVVDSGPLTEAQSVFGTDEAAPGEGDQK